MTPSLIASGYTAEIFELDSERVLKLYRHGFESIAKIEFGIISQLTQSEFNVPEVYELVTIDGREGYIMERINGLSLSTSLEQDDSEFDKALIEVSTLQTKIHSSNFKLTGMSSIHERIENRLVDSIRLGKFKEPVIELHRSINKGTCLCHNDFHFGNIIRDSSGLSIIDWNGAGYGDPLADVAKSYVIMKFAPIGVVFGPKRHNSRSEISDDYSYSYMNICKHSLSALNNWKIIRAAELICLGVSFKDQLLEYIEHEI